LHYIYFPDKDSWFPCNIKYFYKSRNKHDCLSPTCRECEKAKSNNYNNTHKEQRQINRKDYYDKHGEKEREDMKIWKSKNKDKVFEYAKKFQKENPDKISQYSKNRQNKNHKINTKEWIACKDYFKNENGEWCCAYCGALWKDHYMRYAGEIIKSDLHKEHVDHLGNNDLSNCVPSCQSCNSSKHTYILEYWYNENHPNFTQERLDKINKWIEEDWKLYYIEKKPRAKYGSKKNKVTLGQ